MPFSQTDNERRAAHRVGRSRNVDKRWLPAAHFSVVRPSQQNILDADLPTIAAAAATADRAYWVYVGQAVKSFTLNKIRGHVSTGGTGAQTAEMAVATSSSAPNGAAVTLTVVAVSGSLDDLTGTGVLGSPDLSYAVDPSTHIWLGVRTNMASTQPQFYGHTFDASRGEILITSTAGVLAVGTSYTGALITAALTWQAPALFATITT